METVSPGLKCAQEAPPVTALPAQRLSRVCAVLGPSIFLQVISSSLLFAERPKLARAALGSTAKAARALAWMESGGALLETVCNPVSGKASDVVGRRPFLPFAPLAACVMRMFVAIFANMHSLRLDKYVTTACDSMYFTVWRAAVADLAAGDTAEFTRCMGLLGTFAGIAQIIGPITGDALRRVAGSVRGTRVCFAAAAALSLANCLWLASRFEETLCHKERSGSPARLWTLLLRDATPLSFARCVAQSSQLARLFVAVGLQTVTEGRNIGAVNYLLMKDDYGWDDSMVAKLFSGLGLCLIAGGLLVKRSIATFGLRGHTTVSNTFNAVACLFWGGAGEIAKVTGVSTPWTMALALLFATPGMRKRDGLEGLIMRLGSYHGLGRGFISGALMNWRAAFNIVAPLALGHAYAWGVSREHRAPYVPFLACAGALIVSEACVQTLTDSELHLGNGGDSPVTSAVSSASVRAGAVGAKKMLV
mmetsp:Transcript_52702/g.104698  ORF Transcript_52702/g.104698 Transcript_52702/m.104698 type:complete len:478 (-) Transcript_52702:30-1463(-)